MAILIKNVSLLSMKEGEQILENTNIYIENDTIKHKGDIVPDIKVDKVVDGTKKL
ncbi:5-methylthioadenosine/S-adenosylhomocysteine deaminase [Thermoanaerobacter thermohydrosulfuricus]|uniref:Dihydroorotase n=2 Tax=Thermoanaerobacter thermohydrosulfuricus TaxID=1516 RepID=M8CWQ0_THETY|nr:hypothetical protein TthWC1_1666 [Thermoanaerobacter thermohydrosulfuricus WC1]SDG00303.1 5-methylthioadenosine/S-adenosylhomocysteine deaminase [Thermoanaerobacter thermohydrosulfuricus]SFE73680.1 5-methylthioadenosine/S-adenosylhomocysteine deaminase [Thermoanaerobacter thermohydrosulfuricus]